jgi:hypothetical protein
MIGRGVSAPHIGEIYGSRSFFLVTCWANAQPTPNARRPHVVHQSTRFRPRMCLLEVSSIRLILWGVIPEKRLIFGPQMGIPSLNVYGRISAQDKHITTLDSSNCASRQNTQCAIVKTEGWGHCRGQTYKSLLQPNLKSQPKMSNNFLTVHARRKTSTDHL